MKDRSFVIGPGLMLYCTPSGWYTFKWDWNEQRRPDMLTSVIHLRSLIKHGALQAATGPRIYAEDSYRTPEEALEDLCSYALHLRSLAV